jgi:hypothetical protein
MPDISRVGWSSLSAVARHYTLSSTVVSRVLESPVLAIQLDG